MLLGTTAIALVAGLSPSFADQLVWNGSQSSNWSVANNWTIIPGGGNAVPTGSDAVFFDSASVPPAVLSSGTGYANGIDVAQANSGALTVSSGAQLFSSTGIIGDGSHATGAVSVTGAGSNWSVVNGQALYVGNYGNGTLNLTAGGTAGATLVAIGNFAGSSGTVNVDGAGSVFTAAGSLTVGLYGTGMLKVSNAGQVHASNTANVNVTLGQYAGASGAVTIDGNGSKLTTNGLVTIGGAGTGTVALTNGGSFQTTNSIQMSTGIGGQGTLTASGASTSLQVGSTANTVLEVGIIGTASVSLAAGATAGVTGSLFVADQASAGGSVTVSGTGSSLTVSPVAGFGGTATIANQGQGSLTVNTGATATVDGLLVGMQPSGQGTVTIDGKGSMLTVVQSSGGSLFHVGEYGHGSLVITGGATASAAGGYVGAQSGSVGAIKIDGAGSAFTTYALDVGRSGTGTVNVTAGGSLVAHNHLYVGYNTGSTGTLNVDGQNSSASVENLFYVGSGGSGTANITHGGNVTGRDVSVGVAATGRGTLNVDGAGSSLSARDLSVGFSGDGALIVANGGSVVVQNSIQIASQAGSSGRLIIGASTGGTAVGAGTVNAAGIVFGAGNGQLIFNHTSSAYMFDAALSGSGTIYQQAGHTIMTGDSSGFTGIASVTGGTLSVNGTLSGAPVIVNSDGTIGGNGTIGGLQLQGILAPGNSIGTLNVAGNAVIAAGSTFQAQVSPTASDKLAVTGTTLIGGGSVQAQVGAGVYSATNRYTILTSAGGVTGTFAGVTSDAAFLTPSLSYDAKDVYLMLTRNAAAFGSIGTTRNQIASGTAADAYGYGNAMWNAVVMLNAAQARNAFDQLSGDIHASTRSALIEDSRLLRDAAMDRIRDAFSDLGLPGNPAMAYASLDQTPVRRDAAVAIWGRMIGSWGATASDGNAAALSRDTRGIVTGTDALVAEGMRLGVLAGYSRTSLRSDADNASVGSDDYHVGAYAGWQLGALGLRTGAAYSWHNLDTTRTIAFPGFVGRLSSGSRAETAQAFGEFAYRFDVAPHSMLEPFAAAAWVGVRSTGFIEAGSVAALTGVAADTGVTFSTLGLRGSSEVQVGGAIVTLKGALGWRHAFGDVTPTIAVAFAGGSPFTIAGVPIARDAAAIDAGLSIAVTRNATIGIAYSGQIAKGAHDNGAKADFTWRF
ncbi:autotransporter domain-containing protein [Bradyrhizobium sp. U87765 SZCCT0131]|uniref:autotransporter domain-containing protein n=1 Tax=unclassified Bradyrhizobium TaxID=2631580 RepID=UPI001BABFEDD|nr:MULTISPECIES: autotransporter domain-containing protein [unclassified Bradyrhizobium]MBR1217724.1 autotransporter domain-containing protein [Bradyrhizobium sp. U87765 SZCCT0131]MBR1261330.1 autotransporter domain-containing protein [Bradyrhizobium sp. U87765 SZCCT0134]MBR1303222.1 autotransporter domain-containing protein [Bradyrhizobium sp. U87765 SZCCT0110]MBR1318828.1 autotransporter domain-containing protein [Bradyrhizobium sp. U87765 SZCCT0109]MBR1347153.1 autotransporter domain-contai